MRSITSRTDEHVNESLGYIKKIANGFFPKVGIILGTGLGGLVADVCVSHKIDYSDIPYFPVSTVESHHGNLILGKISGKEAVIMQGRFHFYEGYSMQEVTYPVRVMEKLGVHTLIVSNACGGLNPVYSKADLMIMRDHINFLYDTPLKQNTLKQSNKKVYDENLIELAEQTALENNITIQKGVYLSLSGPSLETVAEYRMVRKFGADVVGMSTIPEALRAVNHGMKVLGLSIVTDMGFPDTLKTAVLSEILESAAIAEPKLTLLTKKVIEKL